MSPKQTSPHQQPTSPTCERNHQPSVSTTFSDHEVFSSSISIRHATCAGSSPRFCGSRTWSADRRTQVAHPRPANQLQSKICSSAMIFFRCPSGKQPRRPSATTTNARPNRAARRGKRDDFGRARYRIPQEARIIAANIPLSAGPTARRRRLRLRYRRDGRINANFQHSAIETSSAGVIQNVFRANAHIASVGQVRGEPKDS